MEVSESTLRSCLDSVVQNDADLLASMELVLKMNGRSTLAETIRLTDNVSNNVNIHGFRKEFNQLHYSRESSMSEG
jgi:hypothetical protein